MDSQCSSSNGRPCSKEVGSTPGNDIQDTFGYTHTHTHTHTPLVINSYGKYQLQLNSDWVASRAGNKKYRREGEKSLGQLNVIKIKYRICGFGAMAQQ